MQSTRAQFLRHSARVLRARYARGRMHGAASLPIPRNACMGARNKHGRSRDWVRVEMGLDTTELVRSRCLHFVEQSDDSER